MNTDARPSPDALLKTARREARGRLKIFIGAAPGVGKTFEMLLQGASLLRDGRDVVIGIVETHGRAETEALVTPFEVIARAHIDHGGHRLQEFDLDAALARRPEILLVDELAHTNAAASRHPKRWQDVEELRDAGIDVFTTLNIQHIESLNDVVAGFTRVRVRETVPDALLDDAEIEVIDLPPDELIARLKEGKVYLPDEAGRALGHFFTKSNLSALRELALRRAAQAVDRQMLDHVASTGEAGTWAAGERILVALGPEASGTALVRTGKRLADAFHAPWAAVTVELPHGPPDPARQAQLTEALNLAARLGAALVTIPAASVPGGMRAYAMETRATAIVIGQSRHSWWRRALRGTLADRLARTLPGVALHVLPYEAPPASAAFRRESGSWRGILLALLLVAATTALNVLLARRIGTDAIDMIYLVPVIGAATVWGLRPALIASVAAAFAYNFFFLDPLGTLTIEDPSNVVTFFVLAGVGAVSSHLAGKLRSEANTGARSATENAAIAAFGQRLASVSSETETALAACEEVASLLGVMTVVMTPVAGRAQLVGAVPPDPSLTPVDMAAAEFALARGEVTGCDSATLNAADWQFHPLSTSLGVLAVLGICRADGGPPLPPDRRLLFTTLLGQTALAQERLRLETQARQAAALQQRDDLRTALVSSLGHDLRTPLTAVVAAAEALAAQGKGTADAALLVAQAHRLRRLFDDLVEMTRLEGGALQVRSEAIDLSEAVAAALRAMTPELAEHRIGLDVPPDLPLVRADPTMLHHVLVNLLDNASKYAAAGTTIAISAISSGDGVQLTVTDSGAGIPPGQEHAVFGRFHRVEGHDRQGGTGLGLAIVRGFAEAMGLLAEAANRSDGPGARFTIVWPAHLLVTLPGSEATA